MKFSDKQTVDRLLAERSSLGTKLYAVFHPTEHRSFGISFSGTGEGGEAVEVAAAALVPFYQGKIAAIEVKLKELGLEMDT